MDDPFEIDDGSNRDRAEPRGQVCGDLIACARCGRKIVFYDTPSERWLLGNIKCRPCLLDESKRPLLYSDAERAAKRRTFEDLFGENDLTWQQLIDLNRGIGK